MAATVSGIPNEPENNMKQFLILAVCCLSVFACKADPVQSSEESKTKTGTTKADPADVNKAKEAATTKSLATKTAASQASALTSMPVKATSMPSELTKKLPKVVYYNLPGG